MGGSGATTTSTTGSSTSSTYSTADHPPTRYNRPHVASGRGDAACSMTLLPVWASLAITGTTHPRAQRRLRRRPPLQILGDLVTHPDSPYHDRLLGLPTQSDVVEPDGHFVPPPDLGRRIEALALPATSEASARWARFPELYRTGKPGAMTPDMPPSRFHVEAGVPYFDASEDRTPVRHRLVEYQPGLFLANNGETLDLRGPVPHWRGLRLNPVSNGPQAAQWVLLALVAAVATAWLLTTCSTALRHRRSHDTSSIPEAQPGGRVGRRATTTVAVLGALTAIITAIGIWVVPGIVDVGFLGWLPFPLPVRLLVHLPLAAAVFAGLLVALLTAGALRQWWSRPIRPHDAARAGGAAA